MGHRKTLARVDGVVAAGIHGVTNERGLETYHFPPRQGNGTSTAAAAVSADRRRAHCVRAAGRRKAGQRPVDVRRLLRARAAHERDGGGAAASRACVPRVAARLRRRDAGPRGLANPLPDEPSWWLNDVGATVSRSRPPPALQVHGLPPVRAVLRERRGSRRARPRRLRAAAPPAAGPAPGQRRVTPAAREQGHVRSAVPPPGRRVLGPDQRLRGLPPLVYVLRGSAAVDSSQCGGPLVYVTSSHDFGEARRRALLSGLRGAGNARRDRPPRLRSCSAG